jgi:hypothetical protein
MLEAAVAALLLVSAVVSFLTHTTRCARIDALFESDDR